MSNISLLCCTCWVYPLMIVLGNSLCDMDLSHALLSRQPAVSALHVCQVCSLCISMFYDLCLLCPQECCSQQMKPQKWTSTTFRYVKCHIYTFLVHWKSSPTRCKRWANFQQNWWWRHLRCLKRVETVVILISSWWCGVAVKIRVTPSFPDLRLLIKKSGKWPNYSWSRLEEEQVCLVQSKAHIVETSHWIIRVCTVCAFAVRFNLARKCVNGPQNFTTNVKKRTANALCSVNGPWGGKIWPIKIAKKAIVIFKVCKFKRLTLSVACHCHHGISVSV